MRLDYIIDLLEVCQQPDARALVLFSRPVGRERFGNAMFELGFNVENKGGDLHISVPNGTPLPSLIIAACCMRDRVEERTQGCHHPIFVEDVAKFSDRDINYIRQRNQSNAIKPKKS